MIRRKFISNGVLVAVLARPIALKSCLRGYDKVNIGRRDIGRREAGVKCGCLDCCGDDETLLLMKQIPWYVSLPGNRACAALYL